MENYYLNNSYNGGSFEFTARMQEYQYRKGVDLRAQLIHEEAKTYHEMQKLQFKEYVEEKKAEGIERRKRNRENSCIKICEDSEGALCIETFYPEGDPVISKPILSGTYYRMWQFYGAETKRCVILIASKDMKNPMIFDEQVENQKFVQKLTQAGQTFLVGHDRRKSVAELVLAFLYSQAQEKVIGDHYGWNRTGTKWFWVEDEKTCIDGLLRRRI